MRYTIFARPARATAIRAARATYTGRSVAFSTATATTRTIKNSVTRLAPQSFHAARATIDVRPCTGTARTASTMQARSRPAACR